MKLKSIHNYVLPAVLASFLFSCTTATEPVKKTDEKKEVSKVEVANPQEHIKQTLVNMWDAIENGDIDRYASYIHPDFTQWGETATKLRIGKAAEVKGIKDLDRRANKGANSHEGTKSNGSRRHRMDHILLGR